MLCCMTAFASRRLKCVKAAVVSHVCVDTRSASACKS